MGTGLGRGTKIMQASKRKKVGFVMTNCILCGGANPDRKAAGPAMMECNLCGRKELEELASYCDDCGIKGICPNCTVNYSTGFFFKKFRRICLRCAITKGIVKVDMSRFNSEDD